MSGDGGPGAANSSNRIRRSDVVVLNGEGSVYRDNLSAIRELFLAWLAKERLGIPTVFVNGMVHLTAVMPVLPAMVRKTFRVLDAVTVRDPYSLRNLEEYVPDVHATLIADSAFAIRPEAARDSAAVHEVLRRLGGSSFFCFDPGAMPVDHTPTDRSALFELVVRLKRRAGQAVLVSSAPADTYIKAVAEETDSIYVDTLGDYHEFMAPRAARRVPRLGPLPQPDPRRHRRVPVDHAGLVEPQGARHLRDARRAHRHTVRRHRPPVVLRGGGDHRRPIPRTASDNSGSTCRTLCDRRRIEAHQPG